MDNPPAFPQGKFRKTNAGYSGGELDVCEEISGGMTLRDYFAGQAITHMFQEHMPTQLKAIRAYEVADAMLAERSKESK